MEFRKQLAILEKKLGGHKKDYIARMAGVSTQTVRNMLRSDAKSYAELTIGQQKVYDIVTEYLNTAEKKENKLNSLIS